MVVIHLCVKFSVFAVSMATAGILKFQSLKTMYTHAVQHFYWVSFNSEHFKLFTFFCGNGSHFEISEKFHPIPSTIANQRWISIHIIIIYLETKFRPNRRISVFGGHFVPWLPWQRPPFWIFSSTQKLPHTTVDIPIKFDEVWWKESKFF